MRNQIIAFACEQLGCCAEEPWPDKPGYTVLRHPVSGKWAGIIMSIPTRYIEAGGQEAIDVMNVKLDPALVEGLRGQYGYAPAWHMNKTHWLTVRLDGTVDADCACALLEMSFSAVSPKARKTRKAIEG